MAHCPKVGANVRTDAFASNAEIPYYRDTQTSPTLIAYAPAAPISCSRCGAELDPGKALGADPAPLWILCPIGAYPWSCAS